VPGLDRRPRKRPGKLHADKGYDYARCRRYLRKRGITARIARKGIESKDRPAGTAGWLNEHILGSLLREATNPFRTQAQHSQGAARNRRCGHHFALRR